MFDKDEKLETHIKSYLAEYTVGRRVIQSIIPSAIIARLSTKTIINIGY